MTVSTTVIDQVISSLIMLDIRTLYSTGTFTIR
jgi:hypothetical protein